MAGFRCAIAALFLMIVAAPAHAEWRRAETEHFILYGELPASELRQRAESVERFDELLRRFTAVATEPIGPKFRVYILNDETEVSERFYGRALGVYIPTLRGPFALVPDKEFGIGAFRTPPQQILFHEYAHHFMLQNFPANYPGWYVEGVADFYSTVRFTDDGQVEIGYPLHTRAAVLDGYDSWIDYHELLASDEPLWWSSLTQGWLLVHYAAFNQEARRVLQDYLSAMQRGLSGEQAYSESFGRAGWNLHSAIRRYFREDRVPVTTIPMDFATVEVSIRELSEAEADVALLYPREGTTLGGQIRRTARAHSDDAQALAELAAYQIAGGRFDQAAASAERAIELDPRNVDANLFLGTALIGGAAEAGDDADERWTRGRTALLEANRLDPYNPLALYRYYQSFPAAQNPTDTELAALEQAFRFVPQNREVRLALAVEFIAQQRFDEARLLVMPVFSTVHRGERAEFASDLVDRIERLDSDVSALRPVTRSVEFGS